MAGWKPALLLVAVVAIAYGDILLLGRGFHQADVITYHYPMKSAVREAVAHGEFPYWNPLVSSGQPLAANPAYELWYPPQWLVFLPSFHRGFQLHVIVHFLIAAIGMFVLVRSLGGSIAASIFGSLAFVFCGPYLSLISKLPLLFVLSWMPLALYFTREVLGGVASSQLAGGLRARRSTMFAGAALTLGMQLIVAEPTIIMQTWGLIAAYVIVRARKSFRNDALSVVAIGIAAFLVAAAQLVPALDFARDSVRSEPFPWLFVSNWSMPFSRIAEMLFPSLFHHIGDANGAAAIMTMYAYRTEPYIHEIYLGMLVVILALAGVVSGTRGALRYVVLFALSAIAAAGEHTPLLRILYDWNILRTLRYPEKFIIAAAVATIIWAALMFDRLRDDPRLARNAFRIAIAVAVFALLAVIVGRPGPLETRTYFAINLARAAVIVAMLGPLRKRLPQAAWTIALISLATIDLVASMHKPAARMPRSFFNAPPLVASMPKTDSGRIFHEAAWDLWDQKPAGLSWTTGRTTEDYWRILWNGTFPNLPELYGRALTLEEDIDRTSLKNTDVLRETLRTVRRSGDLARELEILRQSNVRWRIRFLPFAEGSLNAVGIEPVDGNPRYAFQSRGVVTSVRETDNTIRLTTRSAAADRLIIIVTAHKYWRATIDGRAARLIPANVAYQALDVPAGNHTIELRYRNPLVIPSALVSLVTVLALLGYQLAERLRNRRREHQVFARHRVIEAEELRV